MTAMLKHGLRIAVALAAGWLVWALSRGAFDGGDRFLMAWDAGALTYLTIVWAHLLTSGDDLAAASDEDQSHWTLSLLVIAIAGAGMTAIVKSAIADKLDVLSLPTVPISWLLLQTVFTAHYANQYRKGLAADPKHPGFDFPGKGAPRVWDFAYAAFTVGMTFQVSDVTTNTPAMRRMVLAHGVVAFLFNTTIIALAVSLIAK